MFDHDRTDRYGRTLAYIYLQPENLLLNAEIIRPVTGSLSRSSVSHDGAVPRLGAGGTREGARIVDDSVT